jgi:DNA segregation ATPase FtsK/SpoIIIE, S-DNA-T family
MATSKSEKPFRSKMANQPEGNDSKRIWFDKALSFLIQFQRFSKDVGGVLLLIISALTVFALIGVTSGSWVSPWANFLRHLLGGGSMFVVVATAFAGVLIIGKHNQPLESKDWIKIIALELSAFAFIVLLTIIGGNDIESAESGFDGGLIGWGLSQLLFAIVSFLPEFLQPILVGIFVFAVFVIGGITGLGAFTRLFYKIETTFKGELPPFDIDDFRSSNINNSQEFSIIKKKKKVTKQNKYQNFIPEEYRKNFKIEKPVEVQPVDINHRDVVLPGLSLLSSEIGYKPNEKEINRAAGIIEKTLNEFGIPAKVIGFKVGPTITEFAVEPGYLDNSAQNVSEERKKVRVKQILGLKKDITLALSAEQIRIQAPVPGKSYVGIEVPNQRPSMVGMKSILETTEFQDLNSPLGIALGRNVSGAPVVADLSQMPHLLIAGTTGSGKSVGISAIAACLAMNNSPKDLRMVMIDPKMVEMVRFNGLPHLYGNVETDLERIHGVLRWLVAEMQIRYKILEEVGAKNIISFNRKIQNNNKYGHMPYIVVLIDELADLMMLSSEHTETILIRLAQMARAVGIHLVVATQRPSIDVVTGLIKANFPARISYAVVTAMDSKVILDMSGAETLLGKGDMLYLNPKTGILTRAQGVMISDDEIDKIINHWQSSWQQEDMESDSPWEKMLAEAVVMADRDSLAEKAIDIIRQSGKVSTSLLQRRLKVGYPRAARLMDELEEMGVVGPSRGGGKEREVLIGPDYYDDDEDI